MHPEPPIAEAWARMRSFWPRLQGAQNERPIMTAVLWIGLAMTALSLGLLWSTPHPVENLVLTSVSLLLFLTGLLSEDVPAVGRAGFRVLGKLASWFGVSALQAVLLIVGLLLSLASWSAAGTGALAHVRGASALWAFSILVTILALWKPSAEARAAPPGRIHLAVLGLVLAVALGLRLFAIGDLPAAVSGDEGAAGLVGLEFVRGLRNNPFNTSWHSFISLYFGLTSISQRLGAPSLEAIRLVSAAGGLLSILGLYWATCRLFSRTHAILSAAFLACYHIHILFSRIATSGVWDGLFFSLALGGLWFGAAAGRRSGFLVAGLAAGLSHYFHPFSRLILLFAAAWAILLLPKVRRNRQWAGLGSAAIVTLVVLLPLIFLAAHQPQEYLAPLSAGSVTGETSLLAAISMIPQATVPLLVGQLKTTFLGIFLIPLRGVYAPSTPLLLPVPAILLAAGFLLAVIRYRVALSLALLVAFAGPLAIGAATIEAPNVEVLQGLAPAAALLIALPLAEALEISRSHGPAIRRVATAGVVLMMLLVAWLEMRHIVSEGAPFARYAGQADALAWEMGEALADLPDGTPVYLLGLPQIAFAWHPALAYFAANLEPHDLAWPLEPGMSLPEPGTSAVFLFGPEQLSVIEELVELFPGSRVDFHSNTRGEARFAIMEVGP